jgi:hypothetical protein
VDIGTTRHYMSSSTYPLGELVLRPQRPHTFTPPQEGVIDPICADSTPSSGGVGVFILLCNQPPGTVDEMATSDNSNSRSGSDDPTVVVSPVDQTLEFPPVQPAGEAAGQRANRTTDLPPPVGDVAERVNVQTGWSSDGEQIREQTARRGTLDDLASAVTVLTSGPTGLPATDAIVFRTNNSYYGITTVPEQMLEAKAVGVRLLIFKFNGGNLTTSAVTPNNTSIEPDFALVNATLTYQPYDLEHGAPSAHGKQIRGINKDSIWLIEDQSSTPGLPKDPDLSACVALLSTLTGAFPPRGPIALRPEVVDIWPVLPGDR